ncbi:MAG: 4'-phosphopantetheinyl transferase superfamily protein [Desulfobacteraceae bacterium]|jgi:4'-phosphopantetheinyl transferase
MRKEKTAVQLKAYDIHLWVAFIEDIGDQGLVAAYESLMSDQERARYERYRFKKDRMLHLLARALVRTTLSRYADMEPQNWRFAANQYGRPEIESAPGLPPLRFNIAHTNGIVICGVALDRDVGVDVENHERVAKTGGISKRFFSALEYDDLTRLPEEQRSEKFFHYWALKESFIKAHGLGLSLPLGRFSFHLSDNSPLRISFDPRLEDNPEKWQFWLMKPTARHSMAVSLNKGIGPPTELTMRKVVPLRDAYPFSCTIVAQS